MDTSPDRSTRTVATTSNDAAPTVDAAAPAGDRAAIRALLAQTPDERFLGLERAARFFAAAERV